MTFPALAICVCLSALFLVLSGAALASWPLLAIAIRMLPRRPAVSANIIFAGRAFPLLLAGGVVLGLVLPAFLRFEPRASGEAMGAKLLLLAASGGLALSVMVARGIRILQATFSTERRWRAAGEERLVEVDGVLVPATFVTGAPPALLAVTGFFRPRIFVATQVSRMLSPEELSAALAHELAHARFFDNFKRLLLHVTSAPRWLGGMNGKAADAAWTAASEIAADEAALARGASALDLASALVKVGKLATDSASLGRLAASGLLADSLGSSLAMRIHHLEAALAGGPDPAASRPTPRRWKIALAALLFLVAYAAALSTLLPAIHEALELLVR